MKFDGIKKLTVGLCGVLFFSCGSAMAMEQGSEKEQITELKKKFEALKQDKQRLEDIKNKQRLEDSKNDKTSDEDKFKKEEDLLKQKAQGLIELAALRAYWVIDQQQLNDQGESKQDGNGQNNFAMDRLALGLRLGEETFSKVYGRHNIELKDLDLKVQKENPNFSREAKTEFFNKEISKKIEDIDNGVVTEVKD